jgi:4-carboxymuconolactone decarboxylase
MAAEDTVRIPPLAPAAFTPRQAELVGDWTHLAFSRVIVRHPAMYALFVPWIEQLIARSKLPPRDREVLVLRVLGLGRDTYELHHHEMIAKGAGMSEAEIAAATHGGASLSDWDQALMRAAEELVGEQRIADETWARLGARYDEEQLMEVVFLVGCYNTMAMLTRSFGMEIEASPEDFERIEALRDYT